MTDVRRILRELQRLPQELGLPDLRELQRLPQELGLASIPQQLLGEEPLPDADLLTTVNTPAPEPEPAKVRRQRSPRGWTSPTAVAWVQKFLDESGWTH